MHMPFMLESIEKCERKPVQHYLDDIFVKFALIFEIRIRPKSYVF